MFDFNLFNSTVLRDIGDNDEQKNIWPFCQKTQRSRDSGDMI